MSAKYCIARNDIPTAMYVPLPMQWWLFAIPVQALRVRAAASPQSATAIHGHINPTSHPSASRRRILPVNIASSTCQKLKSRQRLLASCTIRIQTTLMQRHAWCRLKVVVALAFPSPYHPGRSTARKSSACADRHAVVARPTVHHRSPRDICRTQTGPRVSSSV